MGFNDYFINQAGLSRPSSSPSGFTVSEFECQKDDGVGSGDTVHNHCQSSFGPILLDEWLSNVQSGIRQFYHRQRIRLLDTHIKALEARIVESDPTWFSSLSSEHALKCSGASKTEYARARLGLRLENPVKFDNSLRRDNITEQTKQISESPLNQENWNALLSNTYVTFKNAPKTNTVIHAQPKQSCLHLSAKATVVDDHDLTGIEVDIVVSRDAVSEPANPFGHTLSANSESDYDADTDSASVCSSFAVSVSDSDVSHDSSFSNVPKPETKVGQQARQKTQEFQKARTYKKSRSSSPKKITDRRISNRFRTEVNMINGIEDNFGQTQFPDQSTSLHDEDESSGANDAKPLVEEHRNENPNRKRVKRGGLKLEKRRPRGPPAGRQLHPDRLGHSPSRALYFRLRGGSPEALQSRIRYESQRKRSDSCSTESSSFDADDVPGAGRFSSDSAASATEKYTPTLRDYTSRTLDLHWEDAINWNSSTAEFNDAPCWSSDSSDLAISIPLALDGMSHIPSYIDPTVNMPIQRQSPSPGPNPQQQHQMNGVAGQNPVGMSHGIQHAGQQADINYLWSVVQELSEVLAHNRTQTASIISGVQRLQARAVQDGSSPTLEQVNGELNASSSNQLGELLAENQALRNRNSYLENEVKENQDLNDSYEAALLKAMEKIRPFAHAHEENRLALIKHYNDLLQDERNHNLALRLEHSKWQDALGRANHCARMALKARVDEEDAVLQKMAGLRRENRVLRRLVNWEIETDSEDEEEQREEDERRLREEEEERARDPGLGQLSGNNGIPSGMDEMPQR